FSEPPHVRLSTAPRFLCLYTLPLHDALPILALLFFTREGYTRQVLFGGYLVSLGWFYLGYFVGKNYRKTKLAVVPYGDTHRLKRSEEHTSELQSRFDLVCRLLHEKKQLEISF